MKGKERLKSRFLVAFACIFAAFLIWRWFLGDISGEKSTFVSPNKGEGAITVTTLSNGLKLVVKEDYRLPIASVQVWYKVGSVDETERIAGISHLLEHMMFKGTQRVGPEEYSKIIQRLGGQVNAGTSKDFTFYYVNVPKEAIGRVLDLEADRMATNLIITKDTLYPEREVVKEERRLRVENDIDGLLVETLYEEAFRVHPYRIDTTGTMQALDAVVPDTLLSYYRRFYAPNNAMIIVVGDVDPEWIKSIVESYFGHIKSVSVDSREIPDESDQMVMRVSSLKKDIDYSGLICGFKIPEYNHEDSPSLVVLEKLLGSSSLKSSRLYQSLVIKKAVVAEVQAIDYQGRYPGLFIIYMQLREGVSHEKARNELFSTLKDVALNGPIQRELIMAKNQLSLDRESQYEKVYGVAMELGLSFIYAGDSSFLSSLYDKALKVEIVDIKRVAKKYFVPELSTFVDLLPTPNKQ